jgi:RNA exonuclease 1
LIQRVVVLFVPGLTPEILSLPPFPITATANPNLPISIPLALPTPIPTSEGDKKEVSTAACIPFIATTFSHACPTRAPGDQNRMHSVMSAVFSGPVSSEEKKKRVSLKKECKCSFNYVFSFLCRDQNTLTILFSAETHNADPTQYLITLEQMIENDYPVPSYMAEVFPKSAGWLEVAKPSETESRWNQKIYAIDCEMVHLQHQFLRFESCLTSFFLAFIPKVYDRRRQGVDPSLRD